MLDHISLGVSDLQRSARFYDAVLETLGYVAVFESKTGRGYAPAGQRGDEFAIRQDANVFAPPREMHVAFIARSREAVMRFHETAISLGAASDGEPGLHPEYSDGYFAAFVIDPDGYRLEAVLHEPVTLKNIDDETLDALLAVAVSETAPEEVLPPMAVPEGWNDARKTAFREFHESRRNGLEGPCVEMTFAISHDGRVVGSGRLARLSSGELETGMWLARSARGRGTGSKALLALAERAADTGATRLIARTTARNLAALGALRNCDAEIGEPDPQGNVEAVIPLSKVASMRKDIPR